MTIKKQIKLMWDYGCSPVWQYNGEIFENVDPELLPLSAAAKSRLEAWASIPEAKLDRNYPPDTVWTDKEMEAFEVEGRELWKTLQKELGEGFYVIYHSTREHRVIRPEDDMV